MKTFLRSYKIPIFGVICMLWATAGMAAPFSSTKPEEALRQAFPQLNFDSIEPSDIPGLYEVVSGQNILYFYPEKQYIIAGDIYNKERKDITAEKRAALSEKLITSIPLDKAVKIGNGKKEIIEFTDPDCPYCKRASEYLKTRTDVTRYIFFAPFAHPSAIKKVYYILAAKDKAKAYYDMVEGSNAADLSPVKDEAVKALAQEQIDIAKKVGVRGTPTFFIKGKMVVGADINRIEQLLKD